LRALIAGDCEQPVAPRCHKYRRFRHGLLSLSPLSRAIGVAAQGHALCLAERAIASRQTCTPINDFPAKSGLQKGICCMGKISTVAYRAKHVSGTAMGRNARRRFYHQPRIAPDGMGASQYQPSVTAEMFALTIIHIHCGWKVS
jgi:hypothetical protein